MSCRLFSDFHCPFSYAMHERLHDLGLMAQISWHGVQHARHSPVPMQTWSGHLASELKQEVRWCGDWRRSCPLRCRWASLTVVRPLPRQPAHSIDGLLAQEFIRSLYQLFWVGGKDISSQQLLQDTAERRGLPPAQICGKTALPIDDQLCVWEARWNETEHSGVPLVQRSRARSWLGSFRPVLSGVSSAKAYACRN